MLKWVMGELLEFGAWVSLLQGKVPQRFHDRVELLTASL